MNSSLSICTYACTRLGGMKNVKNVKKQCNSLNNNLKKNKYKCNLMLKKMFKHMKKNWQFLKQKLIWQ